MPWLLALFVGCVQEFPDVADPCGTWPEPGLYKLTLDMPDKKRKAMVEIGASTGPRDLVVALHGARQSADKFSEVTQFSNLVIGGTDPLVIAYPQGRKTAFWRTWNAGDCCGTIDENHRDALDVEFLDALVKELEDRACVDRTLAAGFSNGGMMAMRWGCESNVPDAVLSAAGPLLTGRCEGPPKPMRAYHGTADEKVPIEGGLTRGENYTWPAATEGWALWRERNECSNEVAEEFIFGTMTCRRYAECAEATEVCTIAGFGHLWPGGRNSAKLQGNATTEALTFLRTNVPPSDGVDDPVDTGVVVDTGR